jgi:hypothetical protein
VTVRRPSERSSREVEGATDNLGFGGAFVLLDPPLPPDTRVVVSIASAITWEPLRLPGVVRWVRDTRPGLAAGMGVAFDALQPEHAMALQRLFEAYGFEEE